MEIEQYFQKSRVRTPSGDLFPVYHGTHSSEIKSLMPDIKENGNDQYGGGVYFSTSYEVACGHSNGEPSHVLECYLNVTNPLVVDGIRFPNLRHVSVDGADALHILYHHSGLYLPPDLDGDAPELNPMSDYLPSFCVAMPQSTYGYRKYIRQMVREYFSPTNMLLLDVFFGRRHGNEFRRAVQKILGYDGVKVSFGTSSHYVAWFPEQIKLTCNHNPTTSPYLME